MNEQMQKQCEDILRRNLEVHHTHSQPPFITHSNLISSPVLLVCKFSLARVVIDFHPQPPSLFPSIYMYLYIYIYILLYKLLFCIFFFFSFAFPWLLQVDYYL